MGVLTQQFSANPMVDSVGVPCRGRELLSKGGDPSDLERYIRIYFPRRYEEMKSYDVIILNGAEYQLFTPKQDKWMYDAIREGAGGINDLSVLSADPEINHAWAYSQTSDTFPNDAEWVAEHDGGRQASMYATLEVNRDYPEPVLTPFIPYGFEDIVYYTAGRTVRPKEGADTLAWQLGNHPEGRVAWSAGWDYEEGRTVTVGSGISKTDFFDPKPGTAGGIVLMNMILHVAQRDLIQDVELYQSLNSNFESFKTKLALVLSLRDFVDRFGANTEDVQKEILRLEEMFEQAADYYRDQEFQASQATISQALDEFSQVEDMARDVKDRALFWVFVIEWLATFSAFFISSFVLWTLMVRRKLYREVKETKFSKN